MEDSLPKSPAAPRSSDPSTCVYACCCPCCAAGDVATAAGKDFCCTCFVIPCVLPCILPCWLNADRKALAARFNIIDPLGGCSGCFFFWLGCHTCMLSQELRQVKHERAGAPRTTVIVQQGAGAGSYQDGAGGSYQPVYQGQQPVYQSQQPVYSPQPVYQQPSSFQRAPAPSAPTYMTQGEVPQSFMYAPPPQEPYHAPTGNAGAEKGVY